MASERSLFSSENPGIADKAKNKLAKAFWWGVEKSTIITVPLEILLIANGAVALGLAGLAVDAVEYKVAKEKQMELGKEYTVSS